MAVPMKNIKNNLIIILKDLDLTLVMILIIIQDNFLIRMKGMEANIILLGLNGYFIDKICA